jgi:hypothetical protein
MSSILNPVFFGVGTGVGLLICTGGVTVDDIEGIGTVAGGGIDVGLSIETGPAGSCGFADTAATGSSDVASDGATAGVMVRSSGGRNSGCCLCILRLRWWEPSKPRPINAYGSPSPPIGRFLSGIELKKFGPGSSRALVIVEDSRLRLPSL